MTVLPGAYDRTFEWSRQVTEAHAAFKDAIARHYKSERDRAEECLGDIIKILDQEGDQVEQILNRLIRHYGRGG